MCAATLNQICADSCRYYFGLSWWVTWFELLVLLGSITVGVSIAVPFKYAAPRLRHASSRQWSALPGMWAYFSPPLVVA